MSLRTNGRIVMCSNCGDIPASWPDVNIGEKHKAWVCNKCVDNGIKPKIMVDKSFGFWDYIPLVILAFLIILFGF